MNDKTKKTGDAKSVKFAESLAAASGDLRKYAQEILIGEHTCKDCAFRVCPAQQAFAGKVFRMLDACDDLRKRQFAETINLVTALSKVRQATVAHATVQSPMGYIYRLVDNALNDLGSKKKK